MIITYNDSSRTFHLRTPHASYLIGLTDREGFVSHLYFGRAIPDDAPDLSRIPARDHPSVKPGERVNFMDRLPVEYPGTGTGDMKEPCLTVETPAGTRACALVYRSHRIYGGKPKLPGLPATWGNEEDCATLELDTFDPVLNLSVTLLYTAFADVDVIARSVVLRNDSGEPLRLLRVLSACIDTDDRGFDLLTLHGNWSAERRINRRPLTMGKQGVCSRRGITSHQEQPFLGILEHTATQRSGEALGMHLVYSGSFFGQAELTQQKQLRAVLGIQPDGFSWLLEPGASFQAPEVVLAYSCTGIGGMTRAFHDLYRQHLVRGKYRDLPRPSLVNNWEATYFDFNTEKILEIGREAAAAGIEMLVLDDGWFGRRDSDNCSLGDWFVYEEKMPGGLRYLSEQLHKMGLRLGLWFEPEMVSPNSDLYRAHPDYALQIPGRAPAESRNQLVLDFSRKDVRDCIYDRIFRIMKSADISYVKWDMNRPLCDLWSAQLPADRQGELLHRYVLGVYEMQERLLNDFPDLLLENCSSGGARFDPGMLYYSPQIWTSDDTEAIDRLVIQEGTALLYPYSTMGAHVAACPSHTNGRVTPFETRGLVSLPGCFGYELDLTKLTPEEKAMIPRQLEDYRLYGPVFRTGDYYRLASFAENHAFDAVMAVTKDRRTAVIIYVEVYSQSREARVRVPLEGLQEDLYYRNEDTGEVRSGAGWMYAGLLLPHCDKDYTGKLIVLTAQ